MLNIPTYIEDPSYRYKMPALATQVQGHGNGIKTSLPNLPDVARHLVVPTEYPLRFFGAELGANIEYRQKEEKSTINGSFRQADLQQLLDKFIEKFVLCPRCNYPELRIGVKKNDLMGRCDACGTRCGIDMRHKLSSYILKHPPPKKLREKQEKPSAKPTQKKTKVKEAKELTIESPIIGDMIARLSELKWETPESSIHKEINAVTLSLEPEFKVYVILKALYANNLHKMLRDPKKMSVLKQYCEGMTDEFIPAFAAVYLPEAQMHQWVPTILKLLYDEEILEEDTLLAWQTQQFESSSTMANAESIEDLRVIASEFLDWLASAEEEEEEEEDDEDEETKEEPKQSAEEETKEEPKDVPEVDTKQDPSAEEEKQENPAGVVNLLANLDDHEDEFDIDDI